MSLLRWKEQYNSELKGSSPKSNKSQSGKNQACFTWWYLYSLGKEKVESEKGHSQHIQPYPGSPERKCVCVHAQGSTHTYLCIYIYMHMWISLNYKIQWTSKLVINEPVWGNPYLNMEILTVLIFLSGSDFAAFAFPYPTIYLS